MAKLLVLYHHPENTTAFDEYYAARHVPLAERIPGLKKFEITAGPITSADGAAPYHFVAILTFESMSELQAGMASAEGQIAVADLANFASGGATVLMYEHDEV